MATALVSTGADHRTRGGVRVLAQLGGRHESLFASKERSVSEAQLTKLQRVCSLDVSEESLLGLEVVVAGGTLQ
jgi:hypothetical protein